MRWLGENTTGLELNPGAKAASIAKAERDMKMELPADLKEYLLANNGQTIASNGVIGNWELLSLKLIVEEWKFQKGMVRKKQFTPNNESDPTPYVKGLWWNPQWIPIVHEATGDLVCVDMDPNTEGTVGQVILFRHDDERRPLIARSLEAWFERIAGDLENGKQTWDKEGESFNDEGFMLSALQGWRGEDQ